MQRKKLKLHGKTLANLVYSLNDEVPSDEELPSNHIALILCDKGGHYASVMFLLKTHNLSPK